jgi:hypothetical protein
VDNPQVSEETIQTFIFTFRLDDSYPIGPWCTVLVYWKSSNFLVSNVLMNGWSCSESTDYATCTPQSTINGGSDLKFTFQDVYVKATVSTNDPTVTTDTVAFLKNIYVKGDWVYYGIDGTGATTSYSTSTWHGYVYYCKNLDGNEDCGGVQEEDVQITVESDINYLKINALKVSPNNLRSTVVKWYSDLFIEFEMQASMPDRSASQVYLYLPSQYEVNPAITDWTYNCFPNFAAFCSVSGSTITLNPDEAVSGTKQIWLVQAINNPTANVTTATV